MSLTSRLMAEAGRSSARADSATARKGMRNQRITNFYAETALGRSLEPQGRLITHGHAVQHITRRRSRPVSREMRARLTDGNAGGDRRSQAPATFGRVFGWNSGRETGDIRRRGGLINLERDHGRTQQYRRHGDGIGSDARNIETHHEILRTPEGNSPERLPEQFIALPAMKFVQEILEITRRRLLVFFQP